MGEPHLLRLSRVLVSGVVAEVDDVGKLFVLVLVLLEEVVELLVVAGGSGQGDAEVLVDFGFLEIALELLDVGDRLLPADFVGNLLEMVGVLALFDGEGGALCAAERSEECFPDPKHSFNDLIY